MTQDDAIELWKKIVDIPIPSEEKEYPHRKDFDVTLEASTANPIGRRDSGPKYRIRVNGGSRYCAWHKVIALAEEKRAPGIGPVYHLEENVMVIS